MREDKVIEVLRGPSKISSRTARNQISVHVLRDGKCTVQVGSRIVLEGVDEATAMQSAEGRKDRLKFSGIIANIKIFRE